MHCKLKIFILTALCVLSLNAIAETEHPERWEAFLSYNKISIVEPASDKIYYVLADGNLFSYNDNDKSITDFTKLSSISLSSNGIKTLAWVKAQKKLLIAYEDYTIDILDNKGNVTTLLGLKNFFTTKSRDISAVSVNGQYVYLTTGNMRNVPYNGVGILKIDMKSETIAETIRYNDVQSGMVVIPEDERTPMTPEEYVTLSGNAKPDGPEYPEFYYSTINNGRIISVRGQYDQPSMAEAKRDGKVQVYDIGSKTWSVLDVPASVLGEKDNWDNIYVDVDPRDRNHIMVAARTGLYEYRNGTMTKYYDCQNNDLITSAAGATHPDYSVIASLQYDRQGNLWLFNMYNDNIICLTADGRWESLHAPIGYIRTYKAMTDSRGYIWNFSSSPFYGIQVLDPARRIAHSMVPEYDIDGNVIKECDRGTIRYYGAAEDKEGNLWLATNGYLLYLTPDDIATIMADGNDRAICIPRQYKINRTDDSGLADYLMSGTYAYDIKIDKYDNKWIGTEDDGVFVLGNSNEVLAHFTKDNSPLTTNLVKDITLDDVNDRAYFGTMNGLFSYDYSSFRQYTDLDDDEIYAYPNPVSPDYYGTIRIMGLPSGCGIKITTASGHVVNTGISSGNSYEWDGRDTSGRRVASGVYMVLITTPDGEEGCVTKIGIVR